MAEKINTNLAKAFDISEGLNLIKISNNLLVYLEANKKKYNSILDVGFKTGNLLNNFKSKKFKCFGSETSKTMLEYTANKYSGLNLKLTNSIISIPFSSSFDIITCLSHSLCAVNETALPLFFKDVFKHLSNHGMFLLEIYTSSPANSDFTDYKSYNNLDFISNFQITSKSEFQTNKTFYLKIDDNFKKLVASEKNYCFNPFMVVDELKKVGFKNVNFVDDELSLLADSNLQGNKVYVLATKK